MFQFPGFALKTLCIQVLSTCFNPLLIPNGNNNKLSGGFPHSEIAGSKPILGSPTLIAEYHVLHRLLLPRHSPNALLALDLIQKKTGLLCVLSTPPKDGQVLNQKSYKIIPATPAGSKRGLHSCRFCPDRAKTESITHKGYARYNCT